MYYSKNYPKNRSQTITVPKNYSGNTFRVIDETDRTYKGSAPNEQKTISGTEHHFDANIFQSVSNMGEKEEKKQAFDCSSPPLSSLLPTSLSEKEGPLSSILQSVTVEDILILGLILAVYANDPNDSLLLILIILLLAK